LNNGEFDHIAPFIDSSKASLDVGANWGQFSLKLAASSSRVVVIEPLKVCKVLAGILPPNCTFLNCAVGETEGNLELKTPLVDGNPVHGMSSFHDLETIGYREHTSQKTSVQRIDDIVERKLGNESVGFIKMDVEGWETHALRGAQETIHRHKPNLLIELWPPQMPEVGRQIEDLGYCGFFFFEHRMFSITAFRHAVHTAPENDWDPRRPQAFRPELHVNNFFFVPI
jgi:FkbM family methyltransferase